MKRMRWSQEWISPFWCHLRDENTGTSVHKSQLGHLTCQQARATENPPERQRAVSYAVCSRQLWGAVGTLCQGTDGENMEISCMFRLHGACHSSTQTWLQPLPQLSVGLEQPSGSKGSRRHHCQRTKHISQIQVGWGEIGSCLSLCSSNVYAVYQHRLMFPCTTLSLLLQKPRYWAVKSCTAIKPLMVKQHVHVQMWVCGQRIANRDCVWHTQFNTVESSEPDLHKGYIKILPLINLSSWFQLWHLWGTALGVEGVCVLQWGPGWHCALSAVISSFNY